MQHPHRLRTLAAAAAVVVLAGCSVGTGAEETLVPEDAPTPDETPLIEPVSPPATDTSRPDVEPGDEGSAPPEDNELGTDDGEQST